MADTVRTMAQVLALIADNTSGDISPQDMRDAIVSLQPATGGCYVSTSAATTFSDTVTPVKAAGTTTVTPALRNFSMPANNRLRYDGAAPVNAVIQASLSMTAASNNQVVSLAIAKNGTVITDSVGDRKIGTGSDVGRAGILAAETLAQNDYVEIFLQNKTSTANVTLDYATFTVVGFVA